MSSMSFIPFFSKKVLPCCATIQNLLSDRIGCIHILKWWRHTWEYIIMCTHKCNWMMSLMFWLIAWQIMQHFPSPSPSMLRNLVAPYWIAQSWCSATKSTEGLHFDWLHCYVDSTSKYETQSDSCHVCILCRHGRRCKMSGNSGAFNVIKCTWDWIWYWR